MKSTKYQIMDMNMQVYEKCVLLQHSYIPGNEGTVWKKLSWGKMENIAWIINNRRNARIVYGECRNL